MFAASQLVQGSITVQQIAQASARLSESAKDPRIGAAIRRQQDASLALAEIQRRFDTATQQGGRVERGGETLSLDELAKQVAAAQTALSDADAALQAASPNYGQLVQEVVPAQDVLAALAPGEAFVSMSLGARERLDVPAARRRGFGRPRQGWQHRHHRLGEAGPRHDRADQGHAAALRHCGIAGDLQAIRWASSGRVWMG